MSVRHLQTLSIGQGDDWIPSVSDRHSKTPHGCIEDTKETNRDTQTEKSWIPRIQSDKSKVPFPLISFLSSNDVMESVRG